ncbi:MAG: serine hydrolase domain-containing protein [Pseudomonadota bacterium]
MSPQLHFIFVLLVLALPLSADAASLRNAKPESVGMSSERLARIGPAMQPYIDRGEVAGTVTLVARDGKVVYRDARGYADVATQRPLAMNSLFRLASQTKPVTAVAAMILLEQGKFRLDDPIARYIPEFADIKVAELSPSGEVIMVKPAQPITIRHLLTHTAGLSTGDVPEVSQKINEMARQVGFGPNETLEETVLKYSRLALGFHPGTRWEYSPAAGINVVGRLVEVLSGMSLWEFDRKYIFEPLGMNDTFYYVPPEKLDRYTVGYQRQRDGSFIMTDPADGTSRFVREGQPKRLYAGAGGLVSTVDDYLRFAQMLLNGGELDGVRILSPKTVELMTSPHAVGIPKIGNLAGNGSAFGLGVNVITDPVAWGEAASKGTFMWGGAFGTTFWIDPEEKLIGLYMMQLGRHQALRIRGDYRALVYGAITR